MNRLLTYAWAVAFLLLPSISVAEGGGYRELNSTSLIQRLKRVSGSRPLLVRRAQNTEATRSSPATSRANVWPQENSSTRVIELTRRFELSLSADGAPSPGAVWAPPKRLLLDRARALVEAREHLELVRAEGVTGTGRGVAIAIIDSGVDLRHPDLLDVSGGTRVEWLLAFGADPYGFYPELEEMYGCDTTQIRCGILGKEQLNALIAGELDGPDGVKITLPSDVIGHGTHVASLAAGNGASNSRYVGIAPEATLIIAQVAQTTVDVSDADVVLATKFAFERAHELQMPAVVNLSLGGDFGPHDGSSAIGQALTDFLDEPGRSIVVAAGNSGGLAASGSSQFQGPYGIHTEVEVPEGNSLRVPLLMPPGRGSLFGTVYVWVSILPGDDLRVGVEDEQGTVAVKPQRYGQSRTSSRGPTEVSVFNGAGDELGLEAESALGAAVILDGKFEAGSSWVIRLEGHGTARLWLEAFGDLGPEMGAGVLFPRATRAQTINVPADSPALISVGATLNRTSWPGLKGGSVELEDFSPGLELRSDTVAFFSSAGPTTGGVLKPDIVAPGAAVVGALSRNAEPTNAESSIFSFSPLCSEPDCALVDAEHAVTLGTSMAAPIVSGAAALLFEQEPTLTQKQIKALLQSGAAELSLTALSGNLRSLSPTSTQLGAGRLDLLRSAEALLVQQGVRDAKSPSRGHTRLLLSDDFARPSARFVVSGLLQLRDADGKVAHAKESELSLSVKRGHVAEPLSSDAPGIYSFSVIADEGTGEQALEVTAYYRGKILATRALPIALDNGVFAGGAELVGGCSLAVQPPRSCAWMMGLLALAVIRRRRRRTTLSSRAEKRRTASPRDSSQTSRAVERSS